VYYVYAHWLLNEGNSSKWGSMEPTEPPLDPPLPYPYSGVLHPHKYITVLVDQAYGDTENRDHS